MSDPYVYPGTDVLINNFDIRDAQELAFLEDLHAQMAYWSVPQSLELTPEGYSTLHKHIFGKLYPWAGEFRKVAISKPGAMFCLPQYIEPQMQKCMDAIDSDQALETREYKPFARSLAHHLSELDAIHPFREGNGRTMRVFIETLTHHRKIPFDTKHITRDAWMNASITSFRTGNIDKMTELLHQTIRTSEFQRKLERRKRPRSLDDERE